MKVPCSRGPQASRGAARSFTVLLGLACAVLALEVLLLVVENRRLRRVLAHESAPAASASPAERPRLRVGDVFGPFTLRAEDGDLWRVEFDAQAAPTLLLVFAEECPACPLVLPDWEEVVPDFLALSARVLGLRLDPPAAGADEEPLVRGFPVLTLTDASEVPLAELATVPVTVLLDRTGSVLFVRYGGLQPEHKNELLRLLGAG